jgi:hypothetical protein
MIGPHVLPDPVDDLVVALASGDEPTLTSDQPGHLEPP